MCYFFRVHFFPSSHGVCSFSCTLFAASTLWVHEIKCILLFISFACDSFLHSLTRCVCVSVFFIHCCEFRESSRSSLRMLSCLEMHLNSLLFPSIFCRMFVLLLHIIQLSCAWYLLHIVCSGRIESDCGRRTKKKRAKVLFPFVSFKYVSSLARCL